MRAAFFATMEHAEALGHGGVGLRRGFLSRRAIDVEGDAADIVASGKVAVVGAGGQSILADDMPPWVCPDSSSATPAVADLRHSVLPIAPATEHEAGPLRKG
jgi:hypothetical protein